jgi:hypothetical protein
MQKLKECIWKVILEYAFSLYYLEYLVSSSLAGQGFTYVDLEQPIPSCLFTCVPVMMCHSTSPHFCSRPLSVSASRALCRA